MTLPYGRYRLSGEVEVFVLALQTNHIDLVIDSSGTIRAAATDSQASDTSAKASAKRSQWHWLNEGLK